MASPVPSDAVAAPLSCGAGTPARRSSRGYLVTLDECRGESWRGRCDASRSTTLAHLGRAPASASRGYPPPWLPARLEHVLIHPWTTGLCCSPAIAASPRRRPPRSPTTTGFRRSTCPNTPTSRSSARRPIRRPVTQSLPDDRYMRTLDPWVSLGAACAVTSRVRLSTAVALPVEHDPITLAKSHRDARSSLRRTGQPGRRVRLEHRRTRRSRRAARAAPHDAARVHRGDAGAVDRRGSRLRRRVRQLRAQLGVAQAGAVAHPGAGRARPATRRTSSGSRAAPTAGSPRRATSTSTSR